MMRHATEIETLHSVNIQSGRRVIGFVGAAGSAGTSAVAQAVAGRMALTCREVLYLDLSQPAVLASDPSEIWLPGDGFVRDRVDRSGLEYDRLVVRPTSGTLFAFQDRELLRALFDRDLHDYRTIIVDLPLIDKAANIDGALAAVACDTVFLVCAAGHTDRQRLSHTINALRSIQAPLSGLILNDHGNPTLGAELARQVRRFSRYLPRACSAAERWLTQTPLLSVRC
jgi:Mrp family chromosome partitioning ATPase